MALQAPLRRLFASHAPTASVEIAADRVTGVTLGRGRRLEVTAVVTEPLPDGVLAPAANATNMTDRAVVSETVGRVLKQLPGAPTRVALVVPDSAAKVSLMTFEEVPARPAELAQLVRWQARKTAPFRIEDAQVAYSAGQPIAGGGREFVVSLMRRDIVEEYETACASVGGHAGIVDLASFSLVNAVLGGGSVDDGDWLLVNAARGYSTIAVVRQGQLILFRTRPAEGDDHLADLVHQTTMYYEDRLEGAGFGRAFLVASTASTGAEDAGILRRSLETWLGTAVEAVDLGVPSAHGGSRDEALPDLMAAPLGLLLRERLVTETG